ncbi:hypothetical protein SERLA73DRAFT_59776 [Serpula lacrymans var. lacrymans S7.3]|uniref:Uncharacterized protein n=1 Tax=Serpula lacrymans var. lacrymans (strain S7.3) TaxID=936435 RepID=F8Q5Q6_SERL3|nr:hypothetical protein SERLA73DRAFT_59776 [Serpula lacrymans var. lacrymans S7.3]
MQSPNDWDSLSLSSSTSSSNSSIDEEDINSRISPTWEKYRCLLHRRGFGLETIRDVKEYHQCPGKGVETHYNDYYSRYKRVSSSSDDSALCKDRGLVRILLHVFHSSPERHITKCDNLFRGTHYCTGRKVMVKAVHLRGREFDIVRFLSNPPIRHDPMNHCIPILDLIEVPKDDVGFIVMEEWSSNFIPETPCCLDKFLDALTQCIEVSIPQSLQ